MPGVAMSDIKNIGYMVIIYYMRDSTLCMQSPSHFGGSLLKCRKISQIDNNIQISPYMSLASQQFVTQFLLVYIIEKIQNPYRYKAKLIAIIR